MKPGWVVEAIRGKPVAETLAVVARVYAKSGLVPMRQIRTVAGRLDGPVGSTTSADFLDGQDRPLHLDLTLRAPGGTPARFGNLPTFYVRFVLLAASRIVGHARLERVLRPVGRRRCLLARSRSIVTPRG